MAYNARVTTHGGRRSRTGGTRGTGGPSALEKEAAREVVLRAVTRELLPLVQAQIANAKGLKYLIVRDKGSGKFLRVTEAMARVKLASSEELVEVWEKDPNVQAFTDLLNRAFDKPKEQTLDVHVQTAP